MADDENSLDRCCGRRYQRHSMATVVCSVASSVTVGVMLFSLSICLAFFAAASDSAAQSVTVNLIQAFSLLVFMVVSVGIMTRAIYFSLLRLQLSEILHECTLHAVVLLSALSLFGVGSITYNGLVISIYRKCFDLLESCTDPKVPGAFAVFLLAHSVRILYVLVATAFCCVFNLRGVERTWKVRFEIAVLIGAALSLCAQDGLNVSSQPSRNCTRAKNISEECTEFFEKDSVVDVVGMPSLYLRTAVVQFLLLYVQVLVCCVFGGLSLNPARRELFQYLAADGGTGATAPTRNRTDSSATAADDNPEGTTTSALDDVILWRRFNERYTACYYTFALTSITVFSVIFCAVLIVLGLVWAFKQNETCGELYVIVGVIRWAFIIVCTIVAITVTFRHVQPRYLRPSGFDYYVVACAFGTLLLSWFTMLANFFTDEKQDKIKSAGGEELIFFEKILNFIQILLQMIFYFYSKNVNLAYGLPSDASHYLFYKCTKQFFRITLTLYALLNFFCWIENIAVVTLLLKRFYEGTFATFIYPIFSPMTFLYRFNCTLVFIELMKRHG